MSGDGRSIPTGVKYLRPRWRPSSPDSHRLIGGTDVCHLDVPALSKPIWTDFKNEDAVLFGRRNNSTRKVPDGEDDQFIAERLEI